jgi:hypothetical protein
VNEEHRETPSVLVARHHKAQNELRRLTHRYDGTRDDIWLRRMAAIRRELAAVYLVASHAHEHHSIEWHGLREASAMHELHANANLDAAANFTATYEDGIA